MPAAAIALTLIVLAPPAAVPANASAMKTEPRADEIVVTGLSKPSTLNAKELARAVKAHREGRAAYAPLSRLFFVVEPIPRGRSLDGMTLTFRSKGGIVPVMLDADRRFVLPTLPGKGWKLVANRRIGSFEILPLVMSPGTADADRLLGDLRLQCHVLWTMVKPQLSILARATAGALGGMCRSSVIPYFEWSDRAIAKAWVSSGSLMRQIELSQGGHAYPLPVHDKSLPNGARVRFRYR